MPTLCGNEKIDEALYLNFYGEIARLKKIICIFAAVKRAKLLAQPKSTQKRNY